MNLILGAMPFFLTTFFISFFSVPIVKKIGFSLGIYAEENHRTVHHGKIVRIGGLAIFIAFYIALAKYMVADRTLNGILIGGIVIFTIGLIDDMLNIKPKYKFLGQLIAAIIAVFYGNIQITGLEFLTQFNLGFLIVPLGFIVSVIWIVGVANAVNFIDGLDGLSCGISFIVLCTIGLLGFFLGRRDITLLSLMMVGAIGGFLPYNFHPASIFVGDCGALFMGYIIACLSLLGFKTSTFIAFGFPIIILFVPLSDTALAIIRRKIKGVKVSQADKSHLHHVLMLKIGLSHRNSVLVLYLMTFLFGANAVLLYFNRKLGLLMLFGLCLIAWIFIELTGMINPKFHPLISLCRKIIGYPKKKHDAIFEANKFHE